MIRIENLSKTFKNNTHALRGLSLSIESNGIFGLVGANGAGKTTLMRILAGIIRPTDGTVEAFGHDLNTRTGRQAMKAELGYLPQELHLYPNLTGREMLDYVAIMKGIRSAKARQAQINELLEMVNLVDAANLRLKTYSGGMKRRIGIAQALLGDPKLIIVDEPTVGLDPEERVKFRNLLSSMVGKRLVILSTHIIEDISHSCHQLAVMNKGQVIFDGSPRQLIQQADGHVWHIQSNSDIHNNGLTVVSTVQLASSVQYRVLGTPDAHYAATPIEPTLEDGYIWLMQHAKASTDEGSILVQYR